MNGIKNQIPPGANGAGVGTAGAGTGATGATAVVTASLGAKPAGARPAAGAGAGTAANAARFPQEIRETIPGVEIGGHYPDGRPMVKCCTHLRCKSIYYSGVERPGLLHLSDVMTYWCNHTQQSVGCDNGDTHPESCQPGRTCCEM